MKTIKLNAILLISLFFVSVGLTDEPPPSERPDYINLVVTSIPGGKIHVTVQNNNPESDTDVARWRIGSTGTWYNLNSGQIMAMESSSGVIFQAYKEEGQYTFYFEGAHEGPIIYEEDDFNLYWDNIAISFYHEYGYVDNSVTTTAITEPFDAALTMQKLTTGKPNLRTRKIFSNYFRFDESLTEYTFYVRYRINDLTGATKVYFSLELYEERDGQRADWNNPSGSHSDHIDFDNAGTVSSVWQNLRRYRNIDAWGWGDWNVGDIVRAKDIKWARLYVALWTGSGTIGGDVDIEFIGVKEGNHPETLGDDYAVSRSFADGMGRAKQSIAIKQSPGRNDIVTPVEFDEVGRQARNRLPYTAASQDGALHDGALSAQQSFYTSPSTGIAGDTHPWSETKFENSPMNRVIEQGAAGATWQPNSDDFDGHTIKTFHRANTGASAVIKWNPDGSTSGVYPLGELIVTETEDENGSSFWEYTDKSGQVVLKKSINGSDVLLTYYVYDNRGNLRIIIPPKANGIYDDDLVTTFEYDDQNRLTSKQISEMTGPIYTVYDNLGRAVLTQDPNLQAEHKWMFTKFDIHGRAILTGIYNHGSAISRSSMQTLLDAEMDFYEERSASTDYDYGYTTNRVFPTNNTEIWTVAYYDDYDFDNDESDDVTFTDPAESGYETEPFNRLRGKVTGSKVKVGVIDGKGGVYLGDRTLDNCPASPDELYYQGEPIVLKPGFRTNPGQTVFIGPNISLPAGYEEGSDTWLSSVSFYDKYGRVIQSQSDNHLGGKNISHIEYDFSGKVLNTKLIHQTDYETVTVRNRFEYDHAGRLLNTYQKNDEDDEILMVNNEYNELGQLIEKNLHSTNGTDFTQSMDYRYNIRGWLTHINNRWTSNDGVNNDDSNDLFGMEFNYQEGYSPLGAVPQYNGNITAVRWKTNYGDSENKKERGYGYSYDDINQLTKAKFARYESSAWSADEKYTVDNLNYDLNGNIESLDRRGPNGSSGYIDELSYTYNGNQLLTVEDGSGVYNNYDFRDMVHTAEEYHYDANGNMRQDDNKGIANIEYNYLNLPTKVVFDNNNRIEWTYTKTGAKLRKMVYMDGALEYTKDYVSGFEYTDNTMEYFATSEGRVVDNAGSWEYQYNLKDHLGNVRFSFAGGTGDMRQIKHYYPFGLEIPALGDAMGLANQYRYNGKELEDDEFANNKTLMWYHYGARYYDPQLGRWHTVDPVDEFYTPYAYGPNSPLNGVDPDGRDWFVNGNTGEMMFVKGKNNISDEIASIFYLDMSENWYNYGDDGALGLDPTFGSNRILQTDATYIDRFGAREFMNGLGFWIANERTTQSKIIVNTVHEQITNQHFTFTNYSESILSNRITYIDPKLMGTSKLLYSTKFENDQLSVDSKTYKNYMTWEHRHQSKENALKPKSNKSNSFYNLLLSIAHVIADLF